ncbi:MAG TPA: sigma-70 family RNA polymerase sigma factor [Solirubrobacterales bacterium]|nr:sigma-70 family RNA polymerase sigma factor [Solirubrobacterales bacterium]
MSPIKGDEEGATLPRGVSAARKRAAIETFVRHESALRRTAQRYSLCADDADDALQRALEILLLKAPTEDPRELIRWTQTVVKHEALAVRRDRERILSGPAAAPRRDSSEDWVALIPSPADGPPERVERRETVARSREALQTLKPQELRALSLLAEGYTYAEIGEITGFSHTKINRCLAEGRERFRSILARSGDGQRCVEMGPLLSAYCDGEAAAGEAAALKEHLRACANCRATLRAYRAAPRAVAALAPSLPLARSLLDRAHDAVAGLSARFSGAGATDSALSQVAATGGTRGAGMAALAKALAICVGTAGGAAACVATGVVPAPLAIDHDKVKAPVLERRIDPTVESEWSADAGVEYEPEPQPTSPQPAPEHQPAHQNPAPAPEPAPSPAPVSAPTGAVEYAPEPAPVAAPSNSAEPSGSSSGSAAGEFGP